MRKALVVIKEFSGRAIGKIERFGEAEAMTKQHNQNLLRDNCLAVDIADDVTSDDLMAVLVPLEAEKWTKDGESDALVDPEDATWTYVPAVLEHYEIQEDSATIAAKQATEAARVAKEAKRADAKANLATAKPNIGTMTLVQLKVVVADLLDLLED